MVPGHLNDLDFSALMCLSFVTKNPKDCISIILTNFEKKELTVPVHPQLLFKCPNMLDIAVLSGRKSQHGDSVLTPFLYPNSMQIEY